MVSMLSDLRFAFRLIAAHRWFSAAVAVTIALGIGINTTVFTLVNAVLLKPVPVPNGERLVTVSLHNTTRTEIRGNVSGVSQPDFLDYRAQNRSFTGLEAYSGQALTLSENDAPPERVRGGRVSAGLFPLLRMPPVLGSGFTPEHEKPGAPLVVLLGHVVWQNRYGGARDIVGRVVRINGQAATIVGVMPEGFRFPNREDAWIPWAPAGDEMLRTRRPLQLFGMLKPGVAVEAAQADLAVLGRRFATEFPATNKDLGPIVRTFHDTYNDGEIRVIFLTMLGAVGFVLLIACANVANMMLARAVARSREIAVRAALGASRGRLVRQLLVESVLLSCLGGMLGLGLARLGVHLFDLATQDVGKPYWIEFTMDWRAGLYFAAVTVASGIVFGLVPALRASRVDLNTALKDGTSAGSRRGGRMVGALVVLQCGLTVVLLAGAGLMVRSFFAAQGMNPFVRAESMLTARVQLPEGRGEAYADQAARLRFHEKLLADLAALPGVTRAAAATNFPGLGADRRVVEIEGAPAPATPESRPRASLVIASPGYLPLIGLPLLSGRGFDERDGEPGREAAVVTREFAAKHWPGEDALGKRFRFLQGRDSTPGAWVSVVGISADIVQASGPGSEARPPLIYLTIRQETWGWMGLLLSTTGDPGALAGALRTTVQRLDPDLPLFEIRTLTEALDRQRWFLVVFGTLFAVFALAGLLMAGVGIYGVVAHATERRTREIGVRMALGATARGIAALVLRRGLGQLGLGLVLGLGGALGATRLMKTGGLIGQVSPYDPLVFAAITAVLIGIGGFACWLPARRATRINPVVALRIE